MLYAQKVDAFILEKIQKSVYEVVVKKPVEGQLQYERALPTDEIDFKIRNDAFYPIGTAFALPDGRLLSAAHVFSPEKNSLMNEFFIRNASGEVFPVDQVFKYSDHQDFIVFNAKGFSPADFFEINENYLLNDSVYTVGNALGDGIVVRDGLLTSKTPESEKGAWEWLRFSAAASPGNSGGPLLDSQGRVIGLIVMKSINENLNYGLPLSEIIKASEGIAFSHKKIRYSIAIFNNYVKNTLYENRITLPLPFSDLRKIMQNHFNSWTQNQVKMIRHEWQEKTFPRGKGSSAILYSIVNMDFPGMIAQRQDGGWGLFSAPRVESSELENEGLIRFGKLGVLTFAHLKKPKGLSLKETLSDSKKLMDLILKGIPFYREVAGQSIRITSLGKAQLFETYQDSFKRKWLVGEWAMDYVDIKTLVYLLPVPDGFILFMRSDNTDSINNGYRYDFQFMADFVCLTYAGNFSAWNEYLTLREFIPESLSNFSLFYQEKKLSFEFQQKAFEGTFSDIQWTDQSSLKLFMSYYPVTIDSAGVVESVRWAPRAIVLTDKKSVFTQIEIKEYLSPSSLSSSSYQELYAQIQNQLFPYDGRLVSSPIALQSNMVAKSKQGESFYLTNVTHAHPDNDYLVNNTMNDLKRMLSPHFNFTYLNQKEKENAVVMAEEQKGIQRTPSEKVNNTQNSPAVEKKRQADGVVESEGNGRGNYFKGEASLVEDANQLKEIPLEENAFNFPLDELMILRPWSVY